MSNSDPVYSIYDTIYNCWGGGGPNLAFCTVACNLKGKMSCGYLRTGDVSFPVSRSIRFSIGTSLEVGLFIITKNMSREH